MVTTYDRLAILVLLSGGLLGAPAARADPSANEKAIMAANAAFYVALNSRDAAAMAKVYAHEAYVVNVTPRSAAPAIGWPAVDKWSQDQSVVFKQLTVVPSDPHVRVNGNTAWVIELEHGTGTVKDGATFDQKLISTNIYEKHGGAWLMVSHQAQATPK